MKYAIPEYFHELFLFKGVRIGTLERLLSKISYETVKYKKGEVIFTPLSSEKRIGFVISGECKVDRIHCDGTVLPLNTLAPYSSFGILSVFGADEEYPTKICANADSTVLFISSDDVISLVKLSSAIAMNVINFLATKASFLNKKVGTFSERSTLTKLATHLHLLYVKQGTVINSTRTKIARDIGVGRASLYRDLETLSNDGIISLEQKKIIIICPEGLERITK